MTATVTFDKIKDGRKPGPLGFQGHEITLGQDEDGDPITSLAFTYDPSVKVAKALEGTRKRVETSLKIDAFMKVVQDLPAKTSEVAKAMVKEVLPEDATDGSLIAEQQKLVKWLNNVASGQVSAPKVLACAVDCDPRMWRKSSTPDDTANGGEA